ncbi:hypothetical protein [Akkermansia sp.]|jgi:hypothetical protein|uniref:hypothetical protein n=2 Tax=Akkermansia sp. TaxID=1872421 RepID=UPI003AAC0E8C
MVRLEPREIIPFGSSDGTDGVLCNIVGGEGCFDFIFQNGDTGFQCGDIALVIPFFSFFHCNMGSGIFGMVIKTFLCCHGNSADSNAVVHGLILVVWKLENISAVPVLRKNLHDQYLKTCVIQGIFHSYTKVRRYQLSQKIFCYLF